MDIVYVIGTESKHGNLELRMSLRSIAMYGMNKGKVIVVGAPPKWLSDEVIKVNVEDKYVYKHSNILMCIEKVVDLGLVDGDFLYSSDDHFYCREVDFDNYPYYIKGPLRKRVDELDPFYNYHKSLCDTRMLCEKHGNVWRRKWRKKMTKGIYGSAGSGDMVVKLPKQFFRFESLLLFPD